MYCHLAPPNHPLLSSFSPFISNLSLLSKQSSSSSSSHNTNQLNYISSSLQSPTNQPKTMDDDTFFPPTDSYSYTSSSDLDFSFTSATTDRTSLTLSFNESRLSTTSSSAATIHTRHHRPHRKSDPHWSAITAATALSSDGALHLHHLKLLRHVGSGDLGRVFLCRLRDNDHHADFALKVVDTDSLSPRKLSHVQTESDILAELDHPFLPTLYASFQASHYTCLLIDYCPNGDLHSFLRRHPRNRLPLDSVRFFAAEVLVALEYLHALGIVYRDLKPENILIREDGHIMLSDFDLCFRADVVPRLDSGARRKPSGKRWWSCFRRRKTVAPVTEFVAEPVEAFSRSCVGTHEYLAPELLTGNGHGNGVDWWAFGVLIYELMQGTTPFKGGSKEATLRNIASSRGVKVVNVGREEVEGFAEASDLIEKLLTNDPRKRLGCARGATDVKQHPFFNGIKWPLIRAYRPPEARGGKGKRHVTRMNFPQSSSSSSLSPKQNGDLMKKNEKLQQK